MTKTTIITTDLHTCPDCGQDNFTTKGLKAHQGKRACLNRQQENAQTKALATPQVQECAARFHAWQGFAKQGATALKLAQYFAGLEVHELYALHHELHGETRGGDGTAMTLSEFIEHHLTVTDRTARKYRNWFLSVSAPAENAKLVKRLNDWWKDHQTAPLPENATKARDAKPLPAIPAVDQADFQAILAAPDEWGLSELFEAPAKAAKEPEENAAQAPKNSIVHYWINQFIPRLSKRDFLQLPKATRERLATEMETAVTEIRGTLKKRPKKQAV